MFLPFSAPELKAITVNSNGLLSFFKRTQVIGDRRCSLRRGDRQMFDSKLMRLQWLLAVVGLLISPAGSASEGTEEALVTRIAFGSCANQSAPQPIWKAINKFDPQVFIWMGDNIYGDIRRPFKIFGPERTIGPWKNAPRFVPASVQEMESRYKKAKSNPDYAHLRQKAKVIGTWDDHDYGLNDAGKEFSEKVTNQRLLLDFLDEPEDSPRRKQEGVYASYTFGRLGKQVKVIILDTRYHRDPLSSDGTILGTSQWAWIEQEMRGPATAITIIVSSIQVISNLTATMAPLFYMEAWGRFPKERERLFNLIRDSKRNGVFFISGDVHFGEISRFDCAVDYPLYDITSSGLTQSVEKVLPSPLQHLLRGAAYLTPSTMRVMDNNCKYKSCTYGQPNFGAIEINWDENPVKLKIQVRDVDGRRVAGVNISLPELRAGNKNLVDTATGGYQRHCSLEVTLPWIIRYRLVIIFHCIFATSIIAFGVLAYTVASLCYKQLSKRKLE